MVEYVGTRSGRARRRESVEVASFVRALDWTLLAAAAALVAYGLWAIHGITEHDVAGNPNYYVIRQGIFVAIGAVAFLATLLIDPDLYRRYKRALYVGTLAIMVFLFLAGTVARGSKRWIDLGFFRLQPSEFGKVVFVLFLAGFIADRGRRISEWRTVMAAIGLAALPMALVWKQPDFGTALVYGAALLAVLFVGGARWLHLAVVSAAALFIAVFVLWIGPAGGVHVLKRYQEQRLTSFVNPGSDPRGVNYNIAQSKTAIGAGGIKGRGVNGATQTRLDYLPEHGTDFAFSALAEQRGFVGAAILLLLYLLVIWRGLKVVAIARDSFSAVVAGGIVASLLFQVFVNVGMTLGIAPITGIPLPFVSVGGSSMIASLVAIGILQAIHLRGRTAGRRRGR
jgi:rod shape determining protein RodA